MNDKLNHLIVGTFTVLGTLCISSGLIMPNLVKFEKTNVGKLEVNQLRISNFKNNEVKLKDIEIEINNTLSLDVKDYLANPNDIEDSVIRRLKLDISNVNANEVGNYNYTITYNKKIYNGTVIVKAKPLPNVEAMTLKSLSYEINTQLSNDVSLYIQEAISDEVKAGIKLDLSNVDTKTAGVYLYSVSYNGKFYTNTITIYEPKANNTLKDTKIETSEKSDN